MVASSPLEEDRRYGKTKVGVLSASDDFESPVSEERGRYVTCAVMWLPLFYCSVLLSIFVRVIDVVYRNSLDISLDSYQEY